MAAEAEREGVPTWVRYGGLAAVLAAVLATVTSLLVATLFPAALDPGTRDALVVGDLVVTYLLLGLLGVVAVYGRYGDALGWTGNLGLFTVAVGAVFGVAATVRYGVGVGTLLQLSLLFGGAALLAVGLRRIQSAPRSAAVLLGLSPVLATVTVVARTLSPGSRLGALAYVLVSLAWGGAWVVLGYHLWRSPAGTARGTATGTTRT